MPCTPLLRFLLCDLLFVGVSPSTRFAFIYLGSAGLVLCLWDVWFILLGSFVMRGLFGKAEVVSSAFNGVSKKRSCLPLCRPLSDAGVSRGVSSVVVDPKVRGRYGVEGTLLSLG